MANQLTTRNDKAGGVTARSLALTVAAVAGSQLLAFTTIAQDGGGLKPCEEINPIFYPESLIAIGGALILGAFVGFKLGRNRNAGRPTG